MRNSFTAAVLACFVALSAFAAVPEYESLRNARVSPAAIQVSDLVLTRDVISLRFQSGAFHFLDPVNGVITAAVYVGEGSYSLTPATAGELRHLRLMTRDPAMTALTETFDHLVLFFTDDTADDIRARGTEVATGSTQAQAARFLEEHLNLQKKDFQTNLHLRVLADLLNGRSGKDGVFIAAVDGKRSAPSLLILDPLGVGNLAAQFGFLGGEEVALLSTDSENGGFWYLSSPKSSAREGCGRPLIRAAEAQHYDVSTTIGSRARLDAATTIRLRALRPGIRVLPVQLLPKLRISKASLADGTAVDFVQEDVRLSGWRRMFQDEVADGDAALIFPAALSTSAPTEVRIEYQGDDVLYEVGADSYSVRARESWYPNIHAFINPASYALTFKYPKSMNLVAVGQKESETVADGVTTSVWKSTEPMRVAGFNYGKFEKRSRKDEFSGVSFDVYTNRDWRKKADDIMADSINAARTATHYFGQPPHSTLSVTQQSEWFFGQSWPTLVFIPTLALTTQTERVFGFEDADPTVVSSINEFAETVSWHEVAHQWWGHKIGWESYRDQWLSEGTAEFTAALVLQNTRGTDHYLNYWLRRRDDILAKPGRVAYPEAGAITQGFRLATRDTAGAAQAMVYYKGAYIMHMLRMMFWDAASETPDARFQAMMRDFLNTYSGKSPSTRDFQTVVERHMVPTMNAAGNGKMDWFFNQWVTGTEIPRLKSDIRISKAADGKFLLTGTISQSGVSDGFITIVPLYADFGGGSIARLGILRLGGNQKIDVNTAVAMPRQPKRVAINMMQDVLAFD